MKMPKTTTVNKAGKSSVLGKKLGQKREDERCGKHQRRLAKFVVFKKNVLPKGTVPKGVRVPAQEKVWTTQTCVLWLKAVWNPRLQRKHAWKQWSFWGFVKSKMEEIKHTFCCYSITVGSAGFIYR